ncbi:hypothetical protein F4809DRAFT_592053 [Biscogniauxia mediterranea]|nr:hypothetical protein F4809DRAFT_592053 [Biscogniauxia mediterranea]
MPEYLLILLQLSGLFYIRRYYVRTRCLMSGCLWFLVVTLDLGLGTWDLLYAASVVYTAV